MVVENMPSVGNSPAAQYNNQEKNPIVQLNDIRRDCVYDLLDGNGPTAEARFTVVLTVDGKKFEGAGTTKKAAKAAAATKALNHPAVVPTSKSTGSIQKLGNTRRLMTDIQSINGRQVCRFYLNSLCLRGKDCPYYHPTRADVYEQNANQQVPKPNIYSWLQLCHNYVNMHCPRNDCKFLHVSQEDEDVFRRTGRIPPHIVEQAIRKATKEDCAPPGVTQACKAYLEGQCHWYSCPFRHLTKKEFNQEIFEALTKQFDLIFKPRSSTLFDSSARLINREDYMYGPSSGRHSDAMSSEEADALVTGMQNMRMTNSKYPDPRQQRAIDELKEQLRHLQEENERLRIQLYPEVNGNYFRAPRPQERYRRPLVNDFQKDQRFYQTQMQDLIEENEDMMRRITSREREMHPGFRSNPRRNYGNPIYKEDYYTNGRSGYNRGNTAPRSGYNRAPTEQRSGFNRVNTESYDFDEVLDSGGKKNTHYSNFGMKVPMSSTDWPIPEQLLMPQNSNNKKKKNLPVKSVPPSTKSSFQVSKRVNPSMKSQQDMLPKSQQQSLSGQALGNQKKAAQEALNQSILNSAKDTSNNVQLKTSTKNEDSSEVSFDRKESGYQNNTYENWADIGEKF